MRIKLSVWGRQTGVSYKTAQRWFYTGKMPVATERTPTRSAIAAAAAAVEDEES